MPTKKNETPAKDAAKADYSMPLPRLPAPETSHFSGMSYEASAATPSPTSAGFPQPRARDPALALSVPKRADVVGGGGGGGGLGGIGAMGVGKVEEDG